MSDLQQGQSMSKAYRLISGGAAYNLALDWQADALCVNNITQWAATAANLPIAWWFRQETDDAECYQHQVIDSSAGASFNFLNPTTNGFTEANTSGGESAFRSNISAVTQADPCVITTSAVHGLQTNQLVRLTDLGPSMPTARGMDQLNNNRYSVTVINTTSFSIQDPITGVDIDSSAFTAWVAGGRVNLESRTNALNYPQQAPYASTPYVPTPFSYDPVNYIMTLGTEVIGDDGDRLFIIAYKFGELVNLGDIG